MFMKPVQVHGALSHIRLGCGPTFSLPYVDHYRNLVLEFRWRSWNGRIIYRKSINNDTTILWIDYVYEISPRSVQTTFISRVKRKKTLVCILKGLNKYTPIT